MDGADIRQGDHVYIGDPAPKKVHWIVVEVIVPTGMVHLLSPFSGQRRFEPADRLTLHPASRKEAS